MDIDKLRNVLLQYVKEPVILDPLIEQYINTENITYDQMVYWMCINHSYGSALILQFYVFLNGEFPRDSAEMLCHHTYIETIIDLGDRDTLIRELSNYKAIYANTKAKSIIETIYETDPSKIDWFQLSKNKSAITILLNNIDKIDFHSFSLNTSMKAIDYLDRHPHLINWNDLSINKKAKSILEKYPDKIAIPAGLSNSVAYDILCDRKIEYTVEVCQALALNPWSGVLQSIPVSFIPDCIEQLSRNPNSVAVSLVAKYAPEIAPVSLVYNPQAFDLFRKQYPLSIDILANTRIFVKDKLFSDELKESIISGDMKELKKAEKRQSRKFQSTFRIKEENHQNEDFVSCVRRVRSESFDLKSNDDL